MKDEGGRTKATCRPALHNFILYPFAILSLAT